MKGKFAERLFAQLCNRYFLKGFTFHSPTYYAPTEKEAGDIVLWVRQQIIIIEIMAREASPGTSTKQFVKRIGEKRNQLKNDYVVFNDKKINLTLTNENSKTIPFDNEDLSPLNIIGIVLVDCEDEIEQLHFKTVEKLLDLPYPTSVMTKHDFEHLLDEVDTIPDLYYYLKDRFTFFKTIFLKSKNLFLDLNQNLEKKSN